jgi:cytochrome c oxidase subunit IV
MKQGLLEWALVTGFLVLAAAGAVALFGDEIHAALAARPAASAPPAVRPHP